MSLTRKLLIAGATLGLTAALLGCTETRYEPVRKEADAEVVDKHHRSAWSQKVGKVTIYHSSKNRVTFQWGNSKLEIDNIESYSTLKKGQHVTLTYDSVTAVTYDDVDEDGKKEEVSRKFDGYRFISAIPR